MITLLIGLLLTTYRADGDRAIIEMIKDAVATNATLVRSGTTHFDVIYTLGEGQPIRTNGTFTWKGEDALWTSRVTDPDGLVMGRDTYTQPIDEAPIEYRLLSGNKFYTYGASSNMLHMSEVVDRQQVLINLFPFDLFPTTLWDRCCPQFRGLGRLWIEMIGPNSPASSHDSTHELTRISPTIYRHIRTDPGEAILTSDYSMEFAGHVVASEYKPLSGQVSSFQIRYEWQKLGQAVVLSRCEAKATTPAGPHRERKTYIAQFDHTDVGSPVPSSKLSFDEFIKLLPRNTIVNNHITNKTYPLHKLSGLPNNSLQELSKKARSSGFSKGTKP